MAFREGKANEKVLILQVLIQMTTSTMRTLNNNHKMFNLYVYLDSHWLFLLLLILLGNLSPLLHTWRLSRQVVGLFL